MAGFYSMFFFLTLYMQNVLGYSQIQAGRPTSRSRFGVAISSGIASQLFARIGTRPIIVAGALLGAGGVYWLSRIPVARLLPHRPASRPDDHVVRARRGLRRRHHRRQRRRPRRQSGTRRRAGQHITWLGGALGLAVFSAIATPRTSTSSPPTPRHPTRSPPASAARCSRAASSSSPPR